MFVRIALRDSGPSHLQSYKNTHHAHQTQWWEVPCMVLLCVTTCPRPFSTGKLVALSSVSPNNTTKSIIFSFTG